MLSLSPRFDLVKFAFPQEWMPKEVEEKYYKIINTRPGVIYSPLDYLNESIQGIKLPGISELTLVQQQMSRNAKTRVDLGKISVEPKHDNSYINTTNPLDNINKEFIVTLRQNQGLYNYFMVYETIFWRVCKPENYNNKEEVFIIDIISEEGTPSCRVKLFDPLVSSLDGIDFSYSKAERSNETFDVNFTFNNIDFDFVDPITNKIIM